jgi:hypothetical protein
MNPGLEHKAMFAIDGGEMLEEIRGAYDKIERLGEYIGEMEKRARWGQRLQRSAVGFALELIAVRDLAKETEAALQMLHKDIAAMLETLDRQENIRIASELIHE